MSTIINLNDQLTEFTGSEQIFRHPFGFLYTEGVQHVAEHYGCHWLIADIFIFSMAKSSLRGESFQTWKLKRIHRSNSFKLNAEDGNYNILYESKIPYSDFSADELTIYLVDGTMLLPSEY